MPDTVRIVDMFGVLDPQVDMMLDWLRNRDINDIDIYTKGSGWFLDAGNGKLGSRDYEGTCQFEPTLYACVVKAVLAIAEGRADA